MRAQHPPPGNLPIGDMTLCARLNWCGFALCAAALLVAFFFMERYLGLAPCPLCVLDRVVVAAMGLVFLAAVALPGARARRALAGVVIALALAGAGVAGRHIWLQSLPPERAPDCAPDLDYLLESFPLFEALAVIFTTSGECAETVWTFLGLSIPQQTLLLFLTLGALGVASFWASFRQARA